MPAIHVNPVAGRRAVTHCQEPLTHLRREYITFIEHPNMWPRIARTKNNRLRCLGCHLTNGVPLAMTQSRSSSMWSSLSEANSRSGHWSSNQWMALAAGVRFPAMWSLFFSSSDYVTNISIASVDTLESRREPLTKALFQAQRHPRGVVPTLSATW